MPNKKRPIKLVMKSEEDKNKIMDTYTISESKKNKKNYIEDREIENVKEFKYLGITIHKRNCNFTPTLIDLIAKATRAIFALTSKVNIKIIPIKTMLKVFDAIILAIIVVKYGNHT